MAGARGRLRSRSARIGSRCPRPSGGLTVPSDGTRQAMSALQRVTPDNDNATHIVEVVGGSAGIAYVGWLADNSSGGYAEYLRAFSITRGWLSDPVQVSSRFGDRSVWPGDTFGISTLGAAGV